MPAAPACQACGEVIAFGSPVIRVQYGTMGSAIKHLRVEDRRATPDDYFHSACAGNVAIREAKP
jgi:hypothetical protein